MLKSLFPAAVLALGALVAGSAQAADAYPTRPIRMVVPLAAGSTSDIVARIFTRNLSVALGQPIVIENRPGAAGGIGVDAAAKAAPDGYTLLFASNGPMAANVTLFKSLPYDPVKDFMPVAYVGSVPMAVVASAASPARSMGDLVRQDKARPGSVNVALQSTTPRIALHEFNQAAGTQLKPIAYKTGSQMIQDQLGGQVDYTIEALTAVLPHVEAGKMRLIAVTSPERMSAFPGVPTLSESGAPGMDLVGWNMLYVPAGTPAAVAERLNTEMRKVLAEPEVQAQLRKLGYEPGAYKRLDELSRFGQAEINRWGRLVRSANVTAE